MKKAVFVLLIAALFLAGCINIPVCGDGICEAGEDATSCPMDCMRETSPLTTGIGGIVNVATINPNNDLVSSNFFFGPNDSVSLKAIAEAADLKPNQMCFSRGDFENSEFKQDIEYVIGNRSGENKDVFVSALCGNNYTLLKGHMTGIKNSGNLSFDYTLLDKCGCNDEGPCCVIVFEKPGRGDDEPIIDDEPEPESEPEPGPEPEPIPLEDNPPGLRYMRAEPVEITLGEIKTGNKINILYEIYDDVGLDYITFYLEQPNGSFIPEELPVSGTSYESSLTIHPSNTGKYQVRMKVQDSKFQESMFETFYIVKEENMSLACKPAPTGHCSDSCTKESDADCCINAGDFCYVKVWKRNRCVAADNTNPENENEICNPELNNLAWAEILEDPEEGTVFLPDLGIGSITISPPIPIAGEGFWFDITLTNSGFADTTINPNIEITCLETDEHANINLGKTIAASESYVFRHQMSSYFYREAIDRSGTLRFKVEIDQLNLITELDETNNIKTESVYVENAFEELCIDSDFGYNYPYRKDTCVGTNGTIEDTCNGTGEASIEHYCFGNACASQYVNCLDGQSCVDGACVEPIIEPPLIYVYPQYDYEINSFHPDAPYDSIYVPIGRDTSGVSRFYIKFNRNDLPAASNILSAQFRIQQISDSHENEIGYSIERIESYWDGNTLGGDNIPESILLDGELVEENTIFTYDVTNMVKDWAIGSVLDYGVIIRKSDEVAEGNGLFVTSNYPNTGQTFELPSLKIYLNS